MIDNALSRRAILALAGLACIGVVGSATAATVSFKVPLTGAEQVPPVTTPGKGSAELGPDPLEQNVAGGVAANNPQRR